MTDERMTEERRFGDGPQPARAARWLLIGGVRSGKSSLAAAWAAERSASVCCIVTATESDAEMSARIAAHRAQRPAHWRVREAPVHLGAALRAESGRGLVLIDCLSVWTANCLWPRPPEGAATEEIAPDLAGWRREREYFLAALADSPGEVILVSNEVGAGIVPAYAAGRVFRDEHGLLNQKVAAACEQVFLVTAGLALRIK